jgi:hypothetical protein
MYVRVVVYAVIRLHRSVYVRPCVRTCVCEREMPFCLLLGLFLSACSVCAVFVFSSMYDVPRSPLIRSPYGFGGDHSLYYVRSLLPYDTHTPFVCKLLLLYMQARGQEQNARCFRARFWDSFWEKIRSQFGEISECKA